MKIVVAGTGSAGLGVTKFLLDYKVKLGMSEAEAYDTFYLVNSKGLVTRKREDLKRELLPFAREELQYEGIKLEETVKFAKPSVLIGLSM